MQKLKRMALFWLLLLCGCVVPGLPVRADTIYDSPYVSFSPDGKAWTVCAGDVDYTHYEKGTTINTGIESTLRAPGVGEHYYDGVERVGSIPIGKWVVNHKYSQCIHDSYPGGSEYHGIEYGMSNCLEYYNSGWIAYCADCGKEIVHMNVYMNKEAAETIDYMECGVGISHYYLCPHCNNLEQGSGVGAHICRQISWNQYRVRYDANAGDLYYAGHMNDSYHMYNNAPVYEGKEVTPVTHLTKNAYSRIGYEFLGWNTEPDGSGDFYADEAEILNLNSYDYKQDGEGAIVTLYAQWKKSESTLRIDPAGGAYEGQAGFTLITREYGSTYTIDSSSIVAPEGYTVSFETNGGTPLDDITGTQHFTEWSQVQPFMGRLINDVYYYIAADGNVDGIRANYVPDSIVLPETEKENVSFGGWYYDEEFEQPAGGPGDEITPSQDITLYAQWVELRLYSEDNYEANNQKGAVDLKWEEPDNRGKAYKLYQSTDAKNWNRINSTQDVGNELNVTENFLYSGNTKTYTVPHTGLYTLTACGAQGGNYGKYTGGRGGMVKGSFWLSAGDVLTYNIGGQNGYGGGGAADTYGCGGGSTTISSRQKGLLLTAGGGGGATSLGNGGSGGSLASIRTDNVAQGASGQAGGGAGYVGGNAGEAIIHYHTDACYKEINMNLISEYGVRLVTDEKLDGEDDDGDWERNQRKVLQIGSPTNLIPVESGAKLQMEASYMLYKATSFRPNTARNGISIYDQNGARIHFYSADDIEKWINSQGEIAKWGAWHTHDNWQRGTTFSYIVESDDEDDDTGRAFPSWLSWDEKGNPYKNAAYENDTETRDSDWWYQKSNAKQFFKPEIINTGTGYYNTMKYVFRENYTIPKGTTGIYIVFDIQTSRHWSDPYVDFSTAGLSGIRKLVCGYANGQVISSKPAYGGSNYVNTDDCVSYEATAGAQGGNGKITIQSDEIGYFEELSLDGVAAPDLAAPEAVRTQGADEAGSGDAIVIEPVAGNEGTLVKVTWTEPEDGGTTYYHKAESHMAVTGTKLCTSNITENTLTTGILGYYYVVDTDNSTNVTNANGMFTGRDNSRAFVYLTDTVQYLHIAAVDVAGNIGETAHVEIGPRNAIEVPWPIYTKPLTIDSGENVYPGSNGNIRYVKADDATPFTLRFDAYLEGSATENYQINRTIYESQMEGCESAWSIVETPMHALQDGMIETDGRGLSFANTGAPVLKNYTYARTIRSNVNREIAVTNQFLLGADAHGKWIRVTPRAGVVNDSYSVYSDSGNDGLNSLYLIGDAEAPVILGMEALEDVQLLDHNQGAFALNLTAEDELSGVRDFYVEIFNTDNAISKKYEPDENEVIRMDLATEEAIFSGDFSITVTAVDNVGNERKITHHITEFAMETKVERILAPHEPVFKRGESGILTITTWGYVEKVEVEFPKELTDLNPDLDRVCVYEIPQYKREEKLQFMVPLYTPYGEDYVITVRAYKGDRNLEDYPELNVIGVEGTILDEIRTRLR